MINRFKDHAANERTYLAWIRTAIAVMAFGFIVEKFDIFLLYITHTVGNTVRFRSSVSIEYIGLGLMLASVLIIVGSTLRFLNYEKAIESDSAQPYQSKWSSIVLAVIMLFFALFLLTYMIVQVVS